MQLHPLYYHRRVSATGQCLQNCVGAGTELEYFSVKVFNLCFCKYGRSATKLRNLLQNSGCTIVLDAQYAVHPLHILLKSVSVCIVQHANLRANIWQRTDSATRSLSVSSQSRKSSVTQWPRYLNLCTNIISRYPNSCNRHIEQTLMFTWWEVLQMGKRPVYNPAL